MKDPRAYYNENDLRMAAWLRELINRNLIAPGDVDERDIRDVVPTELLEYRQCHFFAGIGTWSLALRRAGWPDERPVWTGSCPCQPFSEAGCGGGFADERHLWPSWYHLLCQCSPVVVLGEQVASADGLAWLDLVHADLEAIGYTVGEVVFPAAGVGAPHGRHRIWFVADSDGTGQRSGRGGIRKSEVRDDPWWGGTAGVVGDSRQSRLAGRSGESGDDGSQQPAAQRTGGPVNGFWADAEWVPCRDGKYRPVEPGLEPLAHGAPARVGRLRGYGNGIVVQAAEAFVRSYMEVRN